MLAAAMTLSSCATMTASGRDAGCTAYAEARLAMPSTETITAVPHPWRRWVVDTDTRMTGTCR